MVCRGTVRQNAGTAHCSLGQHYLYYPTQIALLDADGRLQREYWHSGHLGVMLPVDLDHSGVTKILLGGVANGPKMAELVVLDPDTFTGASTEEKTDYQLLGFAPAREETRLFFPRSCVNLHLAPFPSLDTAWREQDEIVAGVRHGSTESGELYYHFNLDLTLRSVGVGSSFDVLHHKLQDNGTLDHSFSAIEAKALRNIVYANSR